MPHSRAYWGDYNYQKEPFMKNLIKAAVTGVLMVGAPISFADNSLGIDVSNVGTDAADFTGVATDTSGRFNENLGWSLSAGIGASDTVDGISADLDYSLAAKLRAGIAAGSGFLYLTGGYGYADVEASAFGISVEDRVNGALYGVEFETFFEESNWGVGLEFNTGSGHLDETDEVLATVKYRF